MGRPGTDASYLVQIGALAEEGRTAPEITQELERWAKSERRIDVPSLKTVRKYLAAHRKQPIAERHQAALFHWPQSMVDGLVPWEASEAALDLLGARLARRAQRPTNRHVRWYHRVLQARPNLQRALSSDPPGSAPGTAGAEGAEAIALTLATWEFARAHGSEPGFTIEEIELLLALSCSPDPELQATWERLQNQHVEDQMVEYGGLRMDPNQGRDPRGTGDGV